MKKIIGVVIVMISLLLLIGCVTQPTGIQTQPTSAPTQPTTTALPLAEEKAAQAAAAKGETHQVVIQNFKFAPTDLEIKIGDSVEWVNKDNTPHTVTIPSLNINEKLAAGATYSHPFSEKGSFDYHCAFHPSMQGKVVVN